MNATPKPTLPETGFLRLPQVLALIPVGPTTWWAGVKDGRYPRPCKLSAKTTAWRAEDIRALIERLGGQGQGAREADAEAAAGEP